MPERFLAAVIACVIGAGHCPAQVGAPLPDVLASVEAARGALRENSLGGADGHLEVSVTDLARSAGGATVRVIRIGPAGADRPAVLVVAGLDPRHRVGVEVAAALAERMARDHGAALADRVLYIIPCLNPDGVQSPLVQDTTRNRALPGEETDADRDGRMDEDPPTDLNGDGLITMMRIAGARPRYGLEPTHVPEKDDPRLMREADRGKGERPTHIVMIESRDADGDGLLGEDGAEGIDFEQNFPYHWAENRDEAGAAPLSRAETRALADFVLAHPEIVAVITYGPGDTLVNPPESGKFDQTGELPAARQVIDGDRAVLARISDRFKEITGQKAAPTGPNAGSFQGWAYAHAGVLSMRTPVWSGPEQEGKEKKAERKKEAPGAGAAEGDAPSETVGDGAASPAAAAEKPRPVDSEEGRWMAYSDEERSGEGFIAWEKVEHPQLGEVEVGGWRPGFRLNPSREMLERLSREQAEFVADVMGRLPRLAIETPAVESLGGDVWRVRVRAVNEAELPTRSAMGVRTRRLPNTRFEVDLPRERVLSGERVQSAAAVAGGGGVLAAEWVVTASAGETVRVRLRSPECGDVEIPVTLDERNERGTP